MNVTLRVRRFGLVDMRNVAQHQAYDSIVEKRSALRIAARRRERMVLACYTNPAGGFILRREPAPF